jgi:hypothetical protein
MSNVAVFFRKRRERFDKPLGLKTAIACPAQKASEKWRAARYP